MTNTFNSFNIEGTFSTTNKQNPTKKFKSKVNTKTAYITFEKQYSDLIKEKGLTVYTSKENKTDFIVLKCAKKVNVYNKKGEIIMVLDTDLDNDHVVDNFISNNPVKLNIILVENEEGNDFARLKAILVDELEDIEFAKERNPFAED